MARETSGDCEYATVMRTLTGPHHIVPPKPLLTRELQACGEEDEWELFLFTAPYL